LLSRSFLVSDFNKEININSRKRNYLRKADPTKSPFLLQLSQHVNIATVDE